MSSSRTILTRALVPATLLMTAGSLWAAAAGVPRRTLFRDPAPFSQAPLYLGVFSTAGLLLWAAAAAVALSAALGLRGRTGDERLRRFLLEAGLLSVALLLDDALLLHENIAPDLTGLPEETFVAPYAVACVAILVRALPALRRRPDRGSLLLAVGLLSLSVLLDVMGTPLRLFTGDVEGARNVAEEATKLLGIVAWAAYLAGVARDAWLGAARAAVPAPRAAADQARLPGLDRVESGAVA